jgi:enoyl-CoA hydratase/carnithine racemase
MSGTYTTFKVKSTGGIMSISFDHPPINLMDKRMMQELRDLLTNLERDDETKVVVFKSANPQFFIAHADLGMFNSKMDTPPPRSTTLNFIHRLFEGYRTLPKATIAVIEGQVNGAGTEFALSLDMQFAADNAKIGQFEVAWGCLPGGTGTQRLPRLSGRSRALEVILGCDEFDGRTAAEYGLINRALRADALHGFVDTLTARIASFPLKAIALAKASVDAALGDPTPGLIEESYLAGQLMVTDEVRRRFRKASELGAQTLKGEQRMAHLLLELDNNT